MSTATTSLALRPRELTSVLSIAIANGMPLLLTGSPGIGKSDIVAQAVAALDADMILSHPAVSDPTDAKGLPWPAEGGEFAKFLPFGDLKRALDAKKRTVWFLDDLGQASPAVQASFMQLLLARQVNEHKLPDCVTFVAATNRRTDRAGVNGILEPVKSRFASIVELTVNHEDWCDWAIENDIDYQVIAFIRLRPELLCDFKPTTDMSNSPSPRTWSRVSQWVKAGLPHNVELTTFSGAVGPGAASEFMAFLRMSRDLPSLEEILLDPEKAPLPKEPNALYAISAGLAIKSNAANFDRVAKYLERMAKAGKTEFAVFCLRDAYRHDSEIRNTKGFVHLCDTEVGDVFSGEVANA